MKPAIALLLLIPACEGPPAPPAARPEDQVECAVDGAAAFERVCTVERTRERHFILRSPSGSFRRLVATQDGRGVMAADGAEAAVVKVIGSDLIEVSIGSDRYRLPARVK